MTVEVEVPLICESQVLGCEQCYREAEYSASRGHECPPPSSKWHSTCEVFGRMKRESQSMHATTHRPVVCERCKGVLWDKVSPPRELTRLCRAGNCTEWYCPSCGFSNSSVGPVGCPCQFRDPKISAIRRSYHRGRVGRW